MQLVAISMWRGFMVLVCLVLIAGCGYHTKSDPPTVTRLTVRRWQTIARKKYVAMLALGRIGSQGWRATSSSTARCQLLLEIVAPEPDSVTTCVGSGRALRLPTVTCIGDTAIILAVTEPVIRQASLILSNGGRIRSKVFVLRLRKGSLVGIYYQILPTRRPSPIGLKEIDGHGDTVRVRVLQESATCRRVIVPRQMPGTRRGAVGTGRGAAVMER